MRGVLRRKPDADIVRAQDVGLSGADDPSVLEWAAQQSRILLAHDVSTITRYAYEQVEAGQEMPGVFEVDCAGEATLVLKMASLTRNRVNFGVKPR